MSSGDSGDGSQPISTKPKKTGIRKSRWLRTTVVLLASVIFVVTGVGLIVWYGQRSLIYYPDKVDPGSAAVHTDNGYDIQLETQDGLTLNAWLIRPNTDALDIAVLFLPGNGGNRLGRLTAAESISALGYTVLLLDYRGYGGNPGKPSETGLVQDARAAAAYLRDHGFPGTQTIYVGESMGTGVAVQLATTDPPAGIVLRSPYTSLMDVAKAYLGWLPADLLLRDRFDTLSYLPEITMPITVLCGSVDTTVPTAQSRRVAEQALSLYRLDVLEGVNHNDSIWLGPYLAQEVDDLAQATID